MSQQSPTPKVVPLAVEEANVSKEDVVRGKVRIRTTTENTEHLVSTELAGEKAEIVRVAVNRYVDKDAELPQIREENGILIVPVLEEVAVVEKRLVLKEELHITRRPTTEIVDVPVTLRKQQAILERLESNGNSPSRSNTTDHGAPVMTRTLTAMFDSRSDASRAADALAAAGISRGSIRILPETDVSSSYTGTTASSYDTDKDEKGFWESLGDFFFPDEDRYSYSEAMNRGSIMLTITVDDAMAERAEDILEEYGTVNMDEREQSWRDEGWSGYSSASSSARSTGYSSAEGFAGEGLSEDASQTIPLAEEELRVGKRDVNRGRVRVRSYVVETPVQEDVNLREETVHVERRPADRAVTGSDADALFQDRTIEVEEHGEEAVVDKRARVREEVAIDKDVVERTERIEDKVRRTEVEVEDDRPAKGTRNRRSKS